MEFIAPLGCRGGRGFKNVAVVALGRNGLLKPLVLVGINVGIEIENKTTDPEVLVSHVASVLIIDWGWIIIAYPQTLG